MFKILWKWNGKHELGENRIKISAAKCEIIARLKWEMRFYTEINVIYITFMITNISSDRIIKKW